MRIRWLALMLLAGPALAGPADGDPDTGAAVDTPAPEPRVVAMHRQLGMVERMHAAVVDGELEVARAAAAELAEPHQVDVPEAWLPWLAVMRDSAARASGEWTHADAARTVTEVARSCGSCHAFTAGGPPEPELIPVQGFEQHTAATRAMWISLIRGDEGGFRAAGELLRGADLGKVPKKDAVLFRQLATRATHATSRAVMADTYGELLGTCTGCHQKLRD